LSSEAHIRPSIDLLCQINIEKVSFQKRGITWTSLQQGIHKFLFIWEDTHIKIYSKFSKDNHQTKDMGKKSGVYLDEVFLKVAAQKEV
jgi:hypothetical protein